MHGIFIQYVYLILIILALVMIANELRLAYPIVLVLGDSRLVLPIGFHTSPLTRNWFSLCARLNVDLKSFEQELEEINDEEESPLKGCQATYLEMLERQRRLLNEMNRSAEFDKELVRKYLLLIDLEEFKIRKKIAGS
jgi:hypothetical protein